MYFPKYWARGDYHTTDPDGVPMDFTCYGWSDASIEDARAKALRQAQFNASKFMTGQQLGRYGYGERPIREEVVQGIPQGGKELGVVTRNGYGALVLNAANAMFIDIDFIDQPKTGGLFGLFAKPVAPEAAILPRIEQWTRRYPGLGVRVYRTAAGLRCLVGSDTFDPIQGSTQEMMEALGGDPLYVTLCRRQQSFRARLTPKPWRCDTDPPPTGFPWESIEQERRYRQWEASYQRNAANYAVCRLVATYGDSRLHPDVQPIVALHDQYCGVQNNNPLA